MLSTLAQRAVWNGFKAFATLRIIAVLWVLLFSVASQRTIIEPDVLCKTDSLPESNLKSGFPLRSALRWDTVCYLLIAEQGYTAQPGLTVWTPVYPILIRVLAFIFQPSILAALVVSSLATWLAFALLYLLVAENYDEGTAKRTLFLYVLYPLSLFLVAGYTESLFLLFVLASLRFAMQTRWGWAGLFAALATLTRIQGVLLATVLLWEGYQQYKTTPNKNLTQLFKTTVISFIPILAFGAFSLYIHEGLGAKWPWQTLGYYWGQETGFPWEGIIGNIKRLFTISTSSDLYWLPTTLVDLLFALLIPIVLWINKSSMKSTYLLYASVMVLVSLMKLDAGGTLISFSRYMLVVFPFFTVASQALNNRYLSMGIVAFGLIFQGIFLFMFHIWSWAG